MQAFDPLTFPLHGQRLIEASAGTGKTFSIALLFLRLLLERKLDVDKILVVTFTTAATEELRTRISARLHEALEQSDLPAEEEGGDGAADRMLARLLDAAGDRREAKTRLADALARMDEAAVYTIHGFCQRMLQENAFESGALFEIEFLESEQPLRSRIIEDYWRRRFYSSPPEEAAWATALWKDPEGLEKNISGVLAKPFVEYAPAISAEQVQRAKKTAEEHYRLMHAAWGEYGDAAAEILRGDKCLSRNRRDGYCPERVEQIVSWMNDLEDNRVMPWVLPGELELLRASVMQGKLIGKKICPGHVFFATVDDFCRAHGEFFRAARVRTLAEAARFLRTEMELRKNSQGRIYYDDLLAKLDRALSGAGAPGLLRRIRDRFAAALVDEFQDTDPIQYRIVKRLFGTGENPALFMIGDPKQSVYSFRGADIFTYIKARRDTAATGRFTMDTNYRSTSAMVRAVNSLFDRRDSFIFTGDIVYRRVKAGGHAGGEPLRLLHKSPLPLQAMIIPPEKNAANTAAGLTKLWAEKTATRWTAHEIARLLAMGAEGKATLGEKNFAGGDLAVLVRTHAEAHLMQQALGKLGIASVYYSQDSVFATEEAAQLYQVLFALLDPSDDRSLRLALITDLFGLSGAELHALQQGDAGRGALAAEVQDYHNCLYTYGPMPLLQMMLARRRMVQRILAEPGGERKLTNYLHLVELLQEAALKLEGADSLIRWFGAQMHNPEPDRASQQLRLESDENLVRIITIHKAKGLEFPVVFLPYLWRTRPVSKDSVFCFHHPDTGGIIADLGTDDPVYYRQAEQERLAEDLRLLYVAVTRARHMCCFCWGRIKGMESTPLAWLLHGKDGEVVPAAAKMDARGVIGALSGLNGPEEPILEYVPYPSVMQRERMLGEMNKDILQAKRFSGKIDAGWTIMSYSQIAARSEEKELQAEPAVVEEKKGGSGKTGETVFDFPRGAAAGNCLHAILEQLDFGNVKEAELQGLVADELANYGMEKEWTPLVCGWIMEILQTPLSMSADLRLMGIRKEDRLAELGFYFSMRRIDIREINRVLTDFSIPPLDRQQVHATGLMKGFIDLVFSSADRFYIADYKSNYLGSGYDDYRPRSLAAAVLEHRYDLQYLIYTVALHRYLGTRMSGYLYERDFGGVYYLFLRGMTAANGPASGIFHTRPPHGLIDRLDRCFGYPENK